MEIAPISGIRNLPLTKAPPANTELTAVFDIENFARIGNETYTPSGGKSAGGREDEFDDPEEESEDQPASRHEGPTRQINFFA